MQTPTFELRKCIVQQETSPGTYLTIDSINGEEVLMSLTGRLRMAGYSLQKGDIVYVTVSGYERGRGRIFMEKLDFRMDYFNDLMLQKEELDKKME
jgi:translation initiation factor IF-1